MGKTKHIIIFYFTHSLLNHQLSHHPRLSDIISFSKYKKKKTLSLNSNEVTQFQEHFLSSSESEQWHKGLLQLYSRWILRYQSAAIHLEINFAFTLKDCYNISSSWWVHDKSISEVSRKRVKNIILSILVLSVLFWGQHKGKKTRTPRQKQSELVVSCFSFSEKNKTSIIPLPSSCGFRVGGRRKLSSHCW